MRVYCSHFDRLYLPKALALIASLRRHDECFRFFAICLDETTRLVLDELAIPGVTTIPLHALEQSDPALVATKADRTLVEYYWTLTPTIVLRTLEADERIDLVTYVDADLFFFSSPEPVFSELGPASVLIHEHRFSRRQVYLRESAGRFNVGLLSFRRDKPGLEVLRWWRERCLEWCYWRLEDGKMGDQMYLNDWPTRFPQVVVLQNQEAGVAPWNHERYLFEADERGEPTVNGKPLLFFHFHSLSHAGDDMVFPSHEHYELDSAVLRCCYLPYLRSLGQARETARSVIPAICDAEFETRPDSDRRLLVRGPRAEIAISPTGTAERLSDEWTLIRPWPAAGVADGSGSPIPLRPSARGKFAELWRTWTAGYRLDRFRRWRRRQAKMPEQREFLNRGKPHRPFSASDTSTPAQDELLLLPPGLPVLTPDDLLRALCDTRIAGEIRTLYIVGAFRFEEKGLLYSLFPNLETVYLFEPLPEFYFYLCKRQRNDPKVHVFPYALSDRDGKSQFHITNNYQSSSLLKLGRHRDVFPGVDNVRTVSVDCRKLETVIREHGLRSPDMLFLDVQGAEVKILSSLTADLRRRLKLIYTEASTEELYVGSGVLDDVRDALSPHFKYLGFSPTRDETPMHGNALFVRFDCVERIGPLTPSSRRLACRLLTDADDSRRFVELQPALLGYFDYSREDPENFLRFRGIQESYFDRQIAAAETSLRGFRDRNFDLSVIVSVYGAGEFIRECLEELTRQTYAPNTEVVVVDAASPDGERAVIAEFQERFDNIKYLRTPTRIGIYPAWNLAVRWSRGRYIAPFSTNDSLRPDAHALLAGMLDSRPDIALVYGDTWLTQEKHERFGEHTPTDLFDGAFRWEDFRYEDLLVQPMIGPHPMWRRSVHDSIGYFDERYEGIGDQDFFLRLAEEFELLHIPEFTGLFWYTDEGLSTRAAAEVPGVHQRFLRRLALRDPDRFKAFRRRHPT